MFLTLTTGDLIRLLYGSIIIIQYGSYSTVQSAVPCLKPRCLVTKP